MLDQINTIIQGFPKIQGLSEHSRPIIERLKPDQQEKYITFLLDRVEDYTKLQSYQESNVQEYVSNTKQKLSDYALQLRTGIMDEKVFQFRNGLFLKDGINPDPLAKQAIPNKVIMAIYDEMLYSIADLIKEVAGVVDNHGIGYIFGEIKNIILTPDFWSAMKSEILSGGVSIVSDSSGDDVLYRKTRQILAMLGVAGLIRSAGKMILKKVGKTLVKVSR